MDETLKLAIRSYFDQTELCELLQISMTDFIRAFEDEIVDNQDLILEEMGLDVKEELDGQDDE